MTLLHFDEGSRISWRFSFADDARIRPRRSEIALIPVVGDTQLAITFAWKRSTGWRRSFGVLLRPMQRSLLWMNLFTISGGISRAFR